MSTPGLLPPIFALPGTLLDERSLAALLQGIDARTAVLGSTSHIDDEVDRLAAWAAGVSSEPAVWLGHSLGGIVALHLARRHPTRVAALVLLGANARAGRDSSHTRRAAQWTLAQEQGLHALAHGKLAPGYGLAADDAALASLVAQANAVGLLRFAHQLAYAAQRPGLLVPLHSLALPVLAISGEHDTLCPPAQSDEIAALVAQPHNAEHHCLAGAGHLFPMQQPQRTAAHLHPFLHRLKEPRP